MHTFKRPKEAGPIDLPTVLKISKVLGIPLTKTQALGETTFKNRDTANPIKEKINA
jgi:hypothetical protein